MNICAFCGIEMPPHITLCLHHHARDASWAEGNRAMCDLVHRKIVPRPRRPTEKDESLREWLIEIAA